MVDSNPEQHQTASANDGESTEPPMFKTHPVAVYPADSAPVDPELAVWDARIDTFWAEFDEDQPEREFASMSALVAERPDGDAVGLYEWASVHDSLGREAEAAELYRQSLDAGLSGERLPQAKIQFASTLRNLGRFDEAIAILESVGRTDVTGDAHLAFLALTQFSAGRPELAARIAIGALSGTLPRYSRSVSRYAAALPIPD